MATSPASVSSSTDATVLIPISRQLLEAVVHALRSYEHGNESPILARAFADRLDSEIRKFDASAAPLLAIAPAESDGGHCD